MENTILQEIQNNEQALTKANTSEHRLHELQVQALNTQNKILFLILQQLKPQEITQLEVLKQPIITKSKKQRPKDEDNDRCGW